MKVDAKFHILVWKDIALYKLEEAGDVFLVFFC